MYAHKTSRCFFFFFLFVCLFFFDNSILQQYILFIASILYMLSLHAGVCLHWIYCRSTHKTQERRLGEWVSFILQLFRVKSFLTVGMTIRAKLQQINIISWEGLRGQWVIPLVCMLCTLLFHCSIHPGNNPPFKKAVYAPETLLLPESQNISAVDDHHQYQIAKESIV